MRRLALLIAMAVPVVSLAEQVPVQVSNLSAIDNSGRTYQGVLSVNQAAGSQQQQINGRALAIGANANATSDFRQYQELDGIDTAMDAQANITGSAFSNGSGVLGVNQSAGAGTQQINSFRVSVGSAAQSVDDSILAQQNVMPAQNSGAAETSSGERAVAIDRQAFAGSSGVVQLNQSAGVGNRMANTVSIRVMD
ncbi:MAG: adhesin [Pseudomonas sagittaria]|nr:adhesin [Pseudomonas sagittaria]